MAKGLVAWRWERASCQVLSSRVDDLLFSLPFEEGAHEDHPYRLQVSYRWEHGGRLYSGDTVGARAQFGSRRAAERSLAAYPAGATTSCFVDPRDPSRASLRRPRPWMLLLLCFPMIFVAFGAVGLVTALRGGSLRSRQAREGLAAPRSLGARAKGRGCAVAAFAIFAVVGAGVLVPFGIVAARLARSARWDQVPATILWSGVGSHSGEDSTTYSIDVLYEYDYGGARHRANRYDFFSGSSSGEEGKEQVVAGLPAGARVDAWVDPADPSRAVLRRSAGAFLWFAFLPLIFLGVGVGGMAISLRSGRKPAVELGGGAGRVMEARAVTPAGPPSGPITLQPAKSRVGSFVALLVFTLFWDGFVGIFLVVMARQGELGHNGCATAFIGVFALIGLLLLLALPKQFLMLFNPRAELTLATPASLGEPVALAWRFHGSSGRLGRLTLQLEGREEATYRRGTDTTTVKRTFARLPLLDTSDAGQIAGGETLLAIPADTMHSFEAPHNKVVWMLTLHGEIARWPDIEDSIEIMVQPRGLAR